MPSFACRALLWNLQPRIALRTQLRHSQWAAPLSGSRQLHDARSRYGRRRHRRRRPLLLPRCSSTLCVHSADLLQLLARHARHCGVEGTHAGVVRVLLEAAETHRVRALHNAATQQPRTRSDLARLRTPPPSLAGRRTPEDGVRAPRVTGSSAPTTQAQTARTARSFGSLRMRCIKSSVGARASTSCALAAAAAEGGICARVGHVNAPR